MQAVKTIGLDIAKSGFQVHGIDADGQVVIRRKLKRRYVSAFFQKLPASLVVQPSATGHRITFNTARTSHPDATACSI
jgi:transposase